MLPRRLLDPFSGARTPILVHPEQSRGKLTPLSPLKSFPLYFQALTGVHFATPLLSDSCRSGWGGGVPDLATRH
jgi:hypothetical protein